MGWIVVHDRNEALAPEVILVLNRFNELLNENCVAIRSGKDCRVCARGLLVAALFFKVLLTEF